MNTIWGRVDYLFIALFEHAATIEKVQLESGKVREYRVGEPHGRDGI